ncbi:MAG TPA: class E sortase [Galbitalea sp.]|jgi:sortase A
MDSAGGGSDGAPSFSKRPRRRKVSAVGVIGELLITAGVFVLLFLGWQLWLGDIIQGAQQQQQAQQLNNSWAKTVSPPAPTPTPAVTDPGPPVVAKAPGNAQKFAILYIPRFGKGWERPIAQGIGVADVLDAIGVGHYPGTAMPGQVGNFAIAAHRHAYGGGFQFLHELHVGDDVYIGTKDGWYKYTFRNIQYVQPTQINVLQPVPMEPGVAPVDRLITMTTCNPFFSTAERMIAYGVYDTWYPRAGGPPAAIATTVETKG